MDPASVPVVDDEDLIRWSLQARLEEEGSDVDEAAHGAAALVRELERSLVEQALERTGGNQTRAGELLGLNRDQIRYRIEKFKLAKKDESGDAGD